MYLMKFSYNFKAMDCFKDQVIYKQDQPANHVYIVQEGMFEVTYRRRNKNLKIVSDTELKLIFNDPSGSK